MTTWGVTAEHVNDTIGERVSEANIKQASAVIDIYINRTEAASAAISPRDLHWIRQAVIWQSAWLREQAGFVARHTVAEQTEGGLRVSAQAGGQGGNVREWTWTLAPMAARALKNLSWKAARAVDVTASKAKCVTYNDFVSEADDCNSGWETL